MVKVFAGVCGSSCYYVQLTGGLGICFSYFTDTRWHVKSTLALPALEPRAVQITQYVDTFGTKSSVSDDYSSRTPVSYCSTLLGAETASGHTLALPSLDKGLRG